MASTPNPERIASTGRRGLKLVSGFFYISKGKSSSPQGEDDHFICDEKKTVGLADGVGGWSNHGIDAGVYARQLMENSVLALQKETVGHVDPLKVLTEAHSNTKAAGSSTACIITLLDDNVLHAVNIGDSGFMLFRKGELIFRSEVQQYAFNWPFQLGTHCRDTRDAQVFKVPVEAGDVIIAGTDGLLDNMFATEIQDVASPVIKQGFDPQEVAWTVAQHAFLRSLDENSFTPFMQASHMARQKHQGGKRDDITVIVSYVKEE